MTKILTTKVLRKGRSDNGILSNSITSGSTRSDTLDEYINLGGVATTCQYKKYLPLCVIKEEQGE